MRTKATARYMRVPPTKARLVLNLVRGRQAGEALTILQSTHRAAARLIEKVLRSAIANAEHNHQVRNLEDLRVVTATADGGPSMKRVQPRAMGRAFFIRHRTSHLTIELTDENPTGARAPARRHQATGARAPARPSGTADRRKG